MPSGTYDDFYGHYKPFVEAFVARRINPDSVADLVAEVFTVAWRRRDVVPENALPWLYRTARNLIGNQYRSHERLQALQDKLRAVPAGAGYDPAETAADRRRLFEAFAGLRDDDRELLLLAGWEGLTLQDIAAVMDLSPGAVSVRLHRARARFEEAMGTRTEDRAPATDIGRTDTTSRGSRS